MKIIPNPAVNDAMIYWDSSISPVKIIVVDINGLKIFNSDLKENQNSFSINTRSIINGLYFVIIQYADGKVMHVDKSTGDIEFLYDALGNRVMKKVINPSDEDATEKYTYYAREANGKVMAVYSAYTNALVGGGDSRILPSMFNTDGANSEWYIYGSSSHGRFAAKKPDTLITYSVALFEEDSIFHRTVRNKKYELKDHLGNVRVVFTDLKVPNAGNFDLDVIASNNYYPFGMMLPMRNYENNATDMGLMEWNGTTR